MDLRFQSLNSLLTEHYASGGARKPRGTEREVCGGESVGVQHWEPNATTRGAGIRIEGVEGSTAMKIVGGVNPG